MPGRHLTDEASRQPSTAGRVGPPTAGVSGSMYDFVRHYLAMRGGACTRADLLEALEADPAMRQRLARSQGFRALLHNMRHSGDLTLNGEAISATSRSLLRLSAGLRKPAAR